MSIEANDTESTRTLLSNSEEIIKLLKAILSGIEEITGQEDLIDNVEE
jgi:hypothetical protein